GDEPHALPRDKPVAYGAPELGLNRDILQIRVLRGKAPGRRAGLDVRGVHPVVAVSEGRDDVDVGPEKLGEFTVRQNISHNCVLILELLKLALARRTRAGRALLLVFHAEPQLVEEYVAELLG